MTTAQELKERYDSLYDYMANSKDPKNMKAFGCVMTEMMDVMIQKMPETAEEMIDQLESIKWKQYLTPKEADVVTIETTGGEPTDEQVLVAIKQDRLAALEAYDASDAVNGFIIRTEQGDVEDWLDTKKRGNAQRAIDAAKKTGVKTLEYVIAGIPISLSVEDADMKLAQIEMYAVQCTAVTERHRVAIESLPAEKAVEGYDFTQGYPSKLIFPLGEANGTVNGEELSDGETVENDNGEESKI